MQEAFLDAFLVQLSRGLRVSHLSRGRTHALNPLSLCDHVCDRTTRITLGRTWVSFYNCGPVFRFLFLSPF